MIPEERWLAANWPFVRAALPAPPARVVEIGCGPLGGFVPMLEQAGYQATGIDPEAPPGPEYRQVEFEHCDLPGQLDAVVACTSLHHVADLGVVLDLVEAALVPGGLAVIVEWARERFDEATARWCFARLPAPHDEPAAHEEPAPYDEPAPHDEPSTHQEHASHDEHGWLDRRQAEWRESGQPWDAYLRSWAEAEGMHSGQQILDELTARFGGRPASYGPYFFPDLAGTTKADEQAAIDAGLIQATRIRYVGRRA